MGTAPSTMPNLWDPIPSIIRTWYPCRGPTVSPRCAQLSWHYCTAISFCGAVCIWNFLGVHSVNLFSTSLSNHSSNNLRWLDLSHETSCNHRTKSWPSTALCAMTLQTNGYASHVSTALDHSSLPPAPGTLRWHVQHYVAVLHGRCTHTGTLYNNIMTVLCLMTSSPYW